MAKKTFPGLPARYDLVGYQGGTIRKTFYWQTGAPPVAVDLTGYVPVLTAGPIVLTTDTGGLVVTPATGKIAVLFTSDDTAALSVGSTYYTLKVTAPNGDVVFLFQGMVEISGPEGTQ